MQRYITRWALSTGIRLVNGEYTQGGKYFHAGSVFVPAKEAHVTFDGAVAYAREMASKKASSLEAQAAKFADPYWQPKFVDVTQKPR